MTAEGSPTLSEEELYDRYLDACLNGEVEEPDTFCARHPGISPVLRARLDGLHAMMREGSSASADPEGDLPFERLGDFRLLGRLRKGGMGMIFLAEQESLGRRVALKLIRPELRFSATATERFRREALAVARLKHRNIVDVYAVGEDEGVRYIAMELVEGEGLDEVLARGPVPTSRAVAWSRDLARALQCAHEKGVVHRDVKPSNILISRDDRPMLLDFGVAKDTRWAGHTLTESFTGSPQYAAPELLSSPGLESNGRIDVYGLGVTLYECLARRLPFDGGTVEQLFHRVLTEEPEPLRRVNPRVSRDLEVIVRKALAKDPARRYVTAGALADDLDALIEFRPIVARPPGRWERFRKWCRRRPGPAAALATAALALAVAVVVLVLQQVASAQQRREDACALVVRCGETLDAYLAKREEMDELERSFTELQKTVHAYYKTREQDREMWAMEERVHAWRREREEVFYEMLELLRRAEQLDPAVTGPERLRARIFMARARDARTERDYQAERVYRARAAQHDPSIVEVVKHEVWIDADVPADVFLFRYRLQSDLVPGGEPRLVPVPVGGRMPVPPGTWALRVVGGAGALRPGDLILEVAGHRIRDTLLVDGSRLVAVDGKPARDVWELEQAAPRRYELADGRTLAEARVETPAQAAERGGVAALTFRDGRVRAETLPAGLRVRTTAAPVFLSPACRAGVTPVELHVDADESLYLAVLRAPGREAARLQFNAPAQERLRRHRLELLPEGTTPPGFVHIPASVHHDRYWMMEREVTAAEYLEFLNDPETRRRIDASGEPILYPRYGDNAAAGGFCPRDDEGRFRLPDDWAPRWPAIGLSWHDAVAYARWRTARSKRWRFALPTFHEWRVAAGHAGRRMFVFGNRFHPKWAKSCYARPKANVEPVLRFPVDESVFGCFDMTGSAMEWLDDWFDEDRGLRRLAGGSWGQAKPEAFKPYGLGVPPEVPGAEFGIRLVMRRKP